MDTDVAQPTFRELVVARVAELADAVDSKSTDESLVGSTPTPGTTFRSGVNAKAERTVARGFDNGELRRRQLRPRSSRTIQIPLTGSAPKSRAASD